MAFSSLLVAMIKNVEKEKKVKSIGYTHGILEIIVHTIIVQKGIFENR